eukprot:m.218379 g.218379  ORF g.218379 m.218379 type:complete len:479 (-) comp18681_c0_seq1:242-1678(-)
MSNAPYSVSINPTAAGLGLPEPTPQRPAGVGSNADTVRQQTIDWTAYRDASHVTTEELKLVTQYDQMTNQPARDNVLAQRGEPLAGTLMQLLLNLSHVPTLQYLVTMVADIMEYAGKQHVEVFRRSAKDSGKQPWAPFLALIERDGLQDVYVKYQACRILTWLTEAGEVLPEREFRALAVWLRDAIRSTDLDLRLAALSALQALLARVSARTLFYGNDYRSVESLKLALRDTEAGFQVQYQAVFCLWLLSFESALATRIGNIDEGAVTEICSALKNTNKEKVVRVCLAALRNLTDKPAEAQAKHKAAEQMVVQKLLPVVENIVSANRYADDPEAMADAEFLFEKLTDCFEHMSTFDEYRNEVMAGTLNWSPVHRSERFWRDCVLRFNENNHELLRRLAHILHHSEDSAVLAVAAHDVGQYVRFYPRGKSNIEKLDAKSKIMELMMADDQELKFEALIAVQKMMTSNWEFLGEKAAGAR